MSDKFLEDSFEIIDNRIENWDRPLYEPEITDRGWVIEPRWKNTPSYDYLRTGDYFPKSLGNPDAIIIGLVRGIPGEGGIFNWNFNKRVNGFTPLTYFENALTTPSKGIAPLSQREYDGNMRKNLRIDVDEMDWEREKKIGEVAMEMLGRASEYLDSEVSIYSPRYPEKQEFIEIHRKEIGRFLEGKL